MNNIPTIPDQIAGDSPQENPQPHEASHTLAQAMEPVHGAKIVILDDGQGAANLFVDLGSSLAPDDLGHPEGVKALIPVFLLDLPPMTHSPATIPPEPGLVRMLATYPGNLPSTADIPVELAKRLFNEVVDHQDCNGRINIPLADITEEWLASFTEHLEIFYVPERVSHYVQTIRVLVARYINEAETSQS